MSFIMISCSGLFNRNKSFVTDGFNAWSEDFSSEGRDEIKKQDWNKINSKKLVNMYYILKNNNNQLIINNKKNSKD